MSDTRCPVRAEIDDDGRWARHVPIYDNGAMQCTDGDPLRSVCVACGVAITRAHRKSAQWRAAASPRAGGPNQGGQADG